MLKLIHVSKNGSQMIKSWSTPRRNSKTLMSIDFNTKVRSYVCFVIDRFLISVGHFERRWLLEWSRTGFIRSVFMMTSSNGNIFRVTGPLCGEFTGQRPVTRSFGVFFYLRLNKRLSKQSRGWWFDMPSHPWWRHCNVFEWLRYLCLLNTHKMMPLMGQGTYFSLHITL